MLAVRLPKKLENELNHFATKLNLTKTSIVKEALILFFQTQEKSQEKSPYELGKTLFGKYDSKQNNLSYTYKNRLKDKLSEKYNINR